MEDCLQQGLSVYSTSEISCCSSFADKTSWIMLETFSEFDTSFYIFGFKTLQTRKSEAAKAGWQIISLPYGTSSEL